MKTYRNEELGFEMDIPQEWPGPICTRMDTILFDRPSVEAMNVVVSFLIPERLPDYTEMEFREHAERLGHTHLQFGRISVGGREHVCVRYHMRSDVWARKYMLVFPLVEFSVTATCCDLKTLKEREPVWDQVVRSFRLSEWMNERSSAIRAERMRVAGELFTRAYEIAAQGCYVEAKDLLEQCLHENPEHIPAHKELAFVLKMMGHLEQAVPHRLEVKRLDPSDLVNRYNLAGLYFVLKQRAAALQEVDELLALEPENKRFLALKDVILNKCAS